MTDQTRKAWEPPRQEVENPHVARRNSKQGGYMRMGGIALFAIAALLILDGNNSLPVIGLAIAGAVVAFLGGAG